MDDYSTDDPYVQRRKASTRRPGQAARSYTSGSISVGVGKRAAPSAERTAAWNKAMERIGQEMDAKARARAREAK